MSFYCNATCTNVAGSDRTCACNDHWEGDGITCTDQGYWPDINECNVSNGGCDVSNATYSFPDDMSRDFYEIFEILRKHFES